MSGRLDESRGSPIRVLMVINRIGAQGGAERSTLEIIEGLHGHGFEFSLFTLWGDDDNTVAEQLRSLGVEVRVGRGGFIGHVRTLRRMIRATRPAVVHSVLFDADMTARAATAFSRTPNLCSLVNTQYDRQAMTRARSRWRLEAVRLLDMVSGWLFVTRFHAISEAVTEHAHSRLRVRRARVSLVYRGRDTARLGLRTETRTAAVREAMGVPDGTAVVLSIGRHEPQKGHLELVRAFAQVATQAPAVLWLAGREGGTTADLRAEADRCGVADRVRFLGVRSDVGDLLAAADVFTFPSLWEGLGGAAIEALALRTPIVASDIPALRDVVGDHGVLVPPGDDAALARAILLTLRDPEGARARSEAGFQRFERCFSSEGMLQGMAALYLDVARRRAT